MVSENSKWRLRRLLLRMKKMTEPPVQWIKMASDYSKWRLRRLLLRIQKVDRTHQFRIHSVYVKEALLFYRTNQTKPFQYYVYTLYTTPKHKALLSTKQTKTNQENNQAIYRWAVKQKENALAEITAESKKNIINAWNGLYLPNLRGGGEFCLISF